MNNNEALMNMDIDDIMNIQNKINPNETKSNAIIIAMTEGFKLGYERGLTREQKGNNRIND